MNLLQKINELAIDGYRIFNVDAKKMPCDSEGHALPKWQTMTSHELFVRMAVRPGLGLGLNLGEQTNGHRIMSLDFDVCGDKGIDGKRLGCAHTAKKLDEYRDGIDRQDGMYSSSTAGNFNVLINYTKCPELVDAVEKCGLVKFTHHHLEIILKGNQVIPPTATTCKVTGELGSPRTFLNDVLFYELTDEPFMISYLLNLFEEKMKLKTTPKAPTAPNAPTKFKMAEQTTDKWHELLFDVIGNQVVDGVKAISWDQWFKIAGTLKFNEYPFETFLRYSVPVSTVAETTKLWEENRRVPPMSMYGLQNIAKEVNPFGYRSWVNKFRQFIPLETLVKGENDVAKYICEQLRGSLIYCDGWWRLDKSNLWVHSKKAPLATIITHLQTIIDVSKEATLFAKSTADEEQKKQLTENEAAYAKFYKAVGTASFSNHIATLLTEYLAVPDFADQLDTSIYTIAYKNGILDLKTLVFRYGIHSTDMLSRTLSYDYEVARPEDVAIVREEIKKICNYNESHTDYYLGALGYALTGDSSKLCELYYLAGQTASNGKSTLLEAITTILPIYVCKTEKCAFDEGNSKVHKEIATWAGKRIVWANEVSASKKNSELLKELTDGTAVKYDRLYSTNALMKIFFKLFLVSNSSLSIEMDAGIARRFRHLQMDSKFITAEEGWKGDRFDAKVFKKNIDLGSLLTTTYRAALLHLLFSYSKKFHDEGMAPYPLDWKAEKDAVVAANDTFRDIFENVFTIGEGLKVSKEEVDKWLKSMGKMNLRDELKRMSIPFSYDSQEQQKIGGKRVKGFYHGFGIV